MKFQELGKPLKQCRDSYGGLRQKKQQQKLKPPVVTGVAITKPAM